MRDMDAITQRLCELEFELVEADLREQELDGLAERLEMRLTTLQRVGRVRRPLVHRVIRQEVAQLEQELARKHAELDALRSGALPPHPAPQPSMDAPSPPQHCRRCETELPAAANYCMICGVPRDTRRRLPWRTRRPT